MKWLCLALCFAATMASAQTIVDGSGDQLDKDEVRSALIILTKDLNDPESARVRNFRKTAALNYCGEINGKNLYGAYVGFRPFAVDVKAKYASILPTTDNFLYGMSRVYLKIAKCIADDRT